MRACFEFERALDEGLLNFRAHCTRSLSVLLDILIPFLTSGESFRRLRELPQSRQNLDHRLKSQRDQCGFFSSRALLSESCTHVGGCTW